jgi:serine acetyltransferase
MNKAHDSGKEARLAVPDTAKPTPKPKGWLRETLRADREMFRFVRVRRGLFKYIYYPDFTVVCIFRLSQYCHGRRALRPLSYLGTMLNDHIFGVYLPPGITAGPGLSLAHPRGTMIHGTAVLGTGVSLLEQCILGGPNIMVGNRAAFSACSTAFSNVRGKGSLTIGHDAMLGARANVVSDVAPRTVVVGNPAKPLRTMEDDEDMWAVFHARRYSVDLPWFLDHTGESDHLVPEVLRPFVIDITTAAAEADGGGPEVTSG